MLTLPEGLTLHPSTPERGRSVRTTRAISAGSTIATFSGTGPHSSPTIAIPDSSRLSETCSHCLRVSATLLNTLTSASNAVFSRTATIPSTPPTTVPRGSVAEVRLCTGCKVSRYCSVACQKADWALGHGKGECKAYKRARLDAMKQGLPQEMPTPVRTLIQVLVRPDMLDAVYETEGHEGEHRTAPGTRFFEMMLQVKAALEYLGLKGEADDVNIPKGLDVTCKLQVNSFNRLDSDFGQSGIYMNAALAMVNHSCIPNAYVSFTGRDGILHAYQDIKEGEEVTISYSNCDIPRSERRHYLKTHYYFTCNCRRCQDDLDIYQTCQVYPNLELNLSDPFSLVRDIDGLRNPPIKQFLSLNKSLQNNIAEILPIFETKLKFWDPVAMQQQVRHRWKLCAQLRTAGLYASDPLLRVLGDASLCFARTGKHAYAFAIECFGALNISPVISPAPFFASRVKSMLMLTRVLSLGPFSTPARSREEFATRFAQHLSKVDQATMCQALLVAIIQYCPAAKSDEWQLRYQAQDLLDDLKSLPGRETENALVDAFAKNPNGPEERRFYNTVVVGPIQEVAGFALRIMEAEFGG
ncbi:uncharacterized protein GGS22DRAFT_14563 [Annulohypoxylon maeteangense]|uniref:uncharacterized protein n=1 Tax=Annulohypoxylon maeteangense TaxID=1927788 RepID=UPI0020082FAD|nr:uncharacterized protein GGS22DRAFT_14563 [Annulohypoxylon maeteangense]KAI0890515.1 hypothetical protein GGS22DRAFT_14563 [Annulohypoxylon maeteangense]